MNVAILGLGTVGKGVYDLLQEHDDFPIRYVLERNESLLEDINAPVASDFDTILNDPDVDIIIELIGGIDVAYDMISRSLANGKHVVTANKAVISRYYKELNDLARKHNVSLMFEASVGGAIIVLNPLFTISTINQLHTIEGIVNGATNFVLTKIFQDHYTSEEAIKEALDLGYLEPNSTDDMAGLDAMRKITILSNIAYQTFISESDVTVVPLRSITSAFYRHVEKLGLTMKYIASSKRNGNKVQIQVMPVVLPLSNRFQEINYELNSISVHGTFHTCQTFIGQGAGRYPTASAVLFDLNTLKQNHVPTGTYVNQVQIIEPDKQIYLVQTTSGFHTTDFISFEEVKQLPDMICFAAMEVDQ